MAISGKLLYLNDTKKLLFNEVSKVSDIESEETFRNYAPKIYEGYLDILNVENSQEMMWEILEKINTSSSNSNLTIDRTEDNALMKIKICGNTILQRSAARLPKEYQEIEYIESTGSQYIDTGLILNQDSGFYIDFVPENDNTNPSPNYFNAGGAGGNSNQRMGLSTYSNGEVLFLDLKEGRNIVNAKGTRVQMSIINKTLTWIDGSTKSISTGSRNTLNSLLLFAAHNDPPQRHSIMKLYNFKIYNGDTVIRNYIPCYRIQDNKVGVYDIIEGAFLESQGTDPMNIGDKIEEEITPISPAEVKTVKGNNTIKVNTTSKVNLFDKDNANLIPGGLVAGRYNVQNLQSNRIVWIPCKPNTTYKVSKKKQYAIELNRLNLATTREVPQINRTIYALQTTPEKEYHSTLSITTGTEDKYLLVHFGYFPNNNLRVVSTIEEMMNSIVITEESSLVDIGNYPINIGNIEMCKLGDYRDYFTKDSGKWYVHKEIGKVVLDGTNNLFETKTGNSGNVYSTNTISNILPVKSNDTAISVIATHFEIYAYSDLNDVKTGLVSYMNSKILRLKFGENSSISTLELANAWLSNNNVTIYYVLETPEEEEVADTDLISQLEAISKAYSGGNRTIITQENEEIAFTLEVQAIKEYEEDLNNR